MMEKRTGEIFDWTKKRAHAASAYLFVVKLILDGFFLVIRHVCSVWKKRERERYIEKIVF